MGGSFGGWRRRLLCCSLLMLDGYDLPVGGFAPESYDAFRQLDLHGQFGFVEAYLFGQLLNGSCNLGILPVHAGELLLLQLEQLEALLVDGVGQVAFFGGDVFKALLLQPERVRVSLDADLDRASWLVGVEIVQGGSGGLGGLQDGVDHAVGGRVVAALEAR